MIQMQHPGGVAHHDRPDAGVHQPFAKLAILSAIAHSLVEAAHLNCEIAPGGGVVAVPGPVRRRDSVGPPGLTRRGGDLEQLVPRRGDVVRAQPGGGKGAAGCDVVLADQAAGRHRQLEVAAG